MTQALAGFNQHGIVLATDSRATRFDAAGRPETFNVNKLFPLNRRTAILSGGAGVSVPLSLALIRQLARHPGPLELEDMVDFAIPFLSQGYRRHLEAHGPEAEGFRRLYFILAAYVPGGAGVTPGPPPAEAPGSPHAPRGAPPYQMVLLGSEDNELPLKRIKIGNLVVMPRNLGMEMRLFKVLMEGADLVDILRLSQEFLESQAALKAEVGPPFHFATVTSRGYQSIIL